MRLLVSASFLSLLPPSTKMLDKVGVRAQLTWYITSTPRIPVLKPRPAHTSIFVVNCQIYIAQAFWNAYAMIDARVSCAYDYHF